MRRRISVPALFASCGTQAAGREKCGASVLRGPGKPKHKTRGRPQRMKGIAWACFIKDKETAKFILLTALVPQPAKERPAALTKACPFSEGRCRRPRLALLEAKALYGHSPALPVVFKSGSR